MFRFIDSFLFSLERIWQHRVLVLWTLIGLSSATILALSLTLYIDSVNTGLLESRLTDPAYAFRFRYLGAWEGNIGRADVTSATAAIEDALPVTLGMPALREVHYLSGGAWGVRLESNQALGTYNIGILEGAEEQINIAAGEWPGEATEPDAIPVMISEQMLFNMGVQVGDVLTGQASGRDPITLEVVALWEPVNSDDPAWIFPPKFFDERVLMQPDDLWAVLDGVENPVDESAWYLIFDGSEVRTSDVDALISNIIAGERTVTTVLPGTRMDLSPIEGLRTFSIEVSLLTQQLITMVLPVAGLVLYFVSLVAGLLVSRQQQEDVTLRSRGMSRSAILGIHVMMWLMMAAIALAVAVVVSPYVVLLVGQTTSFLQFDPTLPPLTILFTPQAIAAGAVTALIATFSGLFLAWRTTGSTITSFKQESARASKAWWQRIYLDVILFVPAVYVLFTLWRRGGIVTAADDPFADPLTFLGPTLFSLSLTLLFLRLWPFFLRIGSNLVAYGSGVALLMTLRELTRSIGRYRGTLLMMCFTLSLSGFTASMASTIDRSLEDVINYRIGSDAVIITVPDAQTEQEASSDGSGQPTLTVTGFNAPPVIDLLAVDGVEDVSRVGRFPSRLVLASQRVDGTVLGVDRAAMAAVTRFREDYSDLPIADLFNELAGQRNGIIINAQTLNDYNLLLGQEVTLQISALGEWYETKVPILGVVDYFPTLDPRASFFAIANIDPIFETVGTELPYDVWLTLEPDADPLVVQTAVREIGFPVLKWENPEEALALAQGAPSRRGVLGFLSVGFVAAITLTLISTIIQSTASFRAQVAQLGSLRAMGLSGLSVSVYLTLLQGMIAGSGILSGTAIGVGTTLLFLPLLDFSGGLPPYLIRVAWSDIILVYSLFAGVLVVVTIFTTILLGRESLATVVKLGE